MTLRRSFKRYIFASLAIFIFFLIVSNYWSEDYNVEFDFDEFDEEETGNLGVCKRPRLDLWPEDIIKIYSNLDYMNCSLNSENWASFKEGKFSISENVIKTHGPVECVYQTIDRLLGDMGVSMKHDKLLIKEGDSIPGDVMSVSCASSNGKVDARVIPGVKPITIKKANDTLAKGLGLNIIMFGFDSVSRLTWRRSLKESYNYFVKELRGSVLTGYNIVGDGTPQALLPILTGKTEEELPESRRGFSGARSVDGHPWIWKDLKKRGYVTQWGEDGAAYGTFTYRMMGFMDQPVDHYLRPFYLADKSYHKNCFGSVSSHGLQLDYIREFISVYGPETKKFSFLFHSDYSHDSSKMLQNADKDLLEFLRWLKDSGTLDNSLLILMSDHGARFTNLRSTEQGKYEERLPFFGLRLPATHSFQKRFPGIRERLVANSRLLTTPFDIHETLLDVLEYETLKEGANLSRPYPRGMSLFREIPMDRNCEDAGIMAHWCTCMRWKKEPTDAPLVKQAAMEVTRMINEMMDEHRDMCAEVRLSQIMSASVVRSRSELLSFKQSRDRHGREADLSDNMKPSMELYQISFITSPNEGEYEATLVYDLKSMRMSVSPNDISRLNAYGKQPACLANNYPHLRAYCFCI